jgi:hypothetical protein
LLTHLLHLLLHLYLLLLLLLLLEPCPYMTQGLAGTLSNGYIRWQRSCRRRSLARVPLPEKSAHRSCRRPR